MSKDSPIGKDGQLAQITERVIEELQLVTKQALERGVAYFELQEVELELALEIKFGPKAGADFIIKVEVGAEQKRLHTVKVKYKPRAEAPAFVAMAGDPTAPGPKINKIKRADS